MRRIRFARTPTPCAGMWMSSSCSKLMRCRRRSRHPTLMESNYDSDNLSGSNTFGKTQENLHAHNESGTVQWLRGAKARRSSKTNGLGRKSPAATDCGRRNAPRPYDSVRPLPPAKAPLVLGNEGAGVVEEEGGTKFPVGSRVMFTGPYGVFEDGTYSEWLAVRKENLCLIPEGVDDVSAAGVPVAYLTAQMALTSAGFRAGKTVLAPA